MRLQFIVRIISSYFAVHQLQDNLIFVPRGQSSNSRVYMAREFLVALPSR